jgi:hypothetical protein
MLVAVTVMTPGTLGATKVALNVVCAEKDPAEADHVTPALPGSLAVAVKLSDWESTRPPRFGVMVTVTLDPSVEAVAVEEKALRLPAASVARTRED